MTRRAFAVLLAFVAPALVLTACGGGPTTPSQDGAVLQGTVVGGATAAAASARGAAGAAADVITVTLQENPAVTTTVGADGRFSLRGLPPGAFTLVFTSGGVTLGTVTFREVKVNQEITVTVRIDGTTVVVLEERRDGIGHGDLEIEGLVQSVVTLNPLADSVFLIDGHSVVARPGQTSIREGNRARTVADVTAGRRVHVKGVWLPTTSGPQMVLAHEIKLQDADDDDDDDDDGDDDDGDSGKNACAPGTKAEVEGLITGLGASSITVSQQGKGSFLCSVSAGTRIRKGNTSYTLADLRTGWRVHVSGTHQGLAATLCQVNASEIKVQNN
jgi:hypothetical protein